MIPFPTTTTTTAATRRCLRRKRTKRGWGGRAIAHHVRHASQAQRSRSATQCVRRCSLGRSPGEGGEGGQMLLNTGQAGINCGTVADVCAVLYCLP